MVGSDSGGFVGIFAPDNILGKPNSKKSKVVAGLHEISQQRLDTAEQEDMEKQIFGT